MGTRADNVPEGLGMPSTENVASLNDSGLMFLRFILKLLKVYIKSSLV